jgi:EmrB/QacA subfamily drug resistance transporter
MSSVTAEPVAALTSPQNRSIPSVPGIGAVPDVAARVPRKALALGVILLAQLLVILDVSIVNLALPRIQPALRFTSTNLQWVISAYALTFGGFLLFGGRAADLLGRRRILMSGVAIFGTASLLCGLATSSEMLIAFRATEGLGAALMAPAALSLIMELFAEGAERNKALGLFGAVGAAGAGIGVLAGGLLTTSLGWRSIFFVNLPVCCLILTAGRAVLPESRADLGHRRFDLAGAATSTSGLSVLVYTLVSASSHHWASATTIVLLAVAAVLLATFVVIEKRSAAPLLPLSFFANRTAVGANLVGICLAAPLFAMFFFLSLYMQSVLHLSALRTGLAFLVICVVIVASSGIAQRLVTKVSVTSVLAGGLLLTASALVMFMRAPVHGHFVADLLPGFVVVGIGIGFAFVADLIAATMGVAPHQAGLASGLINTSQQVGGTLALAVTSAIAAARTSHLVDSGHALAGALTGGFHIAFGAIAIVAVAGAVMTLVIVRIPRLSGNPESGTDEAPETTLATRETVATG